MEWILHPNHSFSQTPTTTTNQEKWTWPPLAWTTVELSEKRTQCVHTQGFTELAWPLTESNVEENDSLLQVQEVDGAVACQPRSISWHVQVPKNSTNWPARKCNVTMFHHGSKSDQQTTHLCPPPTTLESLRTHTPSYWLGLPLHKS